MARIAVIGAGFAGLVLARGLCDRHEVVVYEKSRGPGGRMATRYAGDFEFDHGAQFFTARSSAFSQFLRPLTDAGLVLPWHARIAEFSGDKITARRRWGAEHPHFVGVPRMNVIGKALAHGLDIRFGTRVLALSRSESGWKLEIGDRAATADWVFVTAPLAQARDLLAAVPAFSRAVGERTMPGCYALMLGFDAPLPLSFDAARVREADVSWIAVNSSKPGRRSPVTMVAHASDRWAEANMDLDIAEVLGHMTEEVSRVTGIAVTGAAHQAVHRWRYAHSPATSGATHFIDQDLNVAAAGDWWLGGRVESAFQSAHALLNEFHSQRR